MYTCTCIYKENDFLNLLFNGHIDNKLYICLVLGLSLRGSMEERSPVLKLAVYSLVGVREKFEFMECRHHREIKFLTQTPESLAELLHV